MTVASRNVLAFIALMIVVTASTWALGLLDSKYNVESDIAFSQGFPGDISLWQRAGDWSNVDINNSKITVRRDTNNRSFAKRNFSLPTYAGRTAHKLRIKGEIVTNTQPLMPADVPGAAYMIWLENDQKEVLQYLTIQGLTGSQAKYDAERIISIPDAVTSFTLALNSRDSSNSFSLTNASVQIISISPSYQFRSILLIGSWIIVFILCGKWLYKHATRSLFVTSSLLISGIIIGVMLPESATVEFVIPIFKAVASSIPAFDTSAAQSTYKLGHFLFFFLISLVVMFNASSLPTGKLTLVFILVLFAVASEGMQLHLFNRTTRLSDISIDCAGILFGWLLAALFRPSTKT